LKTVRRGEKKKDAFVYDGADVSIIGAEEKL